MAFASWKGSVSVYIYIYVTAWPSFVPKASGITLQTFLISHFWDSLYGMELFSLAPRYSLFDREFCRSQWHAHVDSLPRDFTFKFAITLGFEASITTNYRSGATAGRLHGVSAPPFFAGALVLKSPSLCSQILALTDVLQVRGKIAEVGLKRGRFLEWLRGLNRL